MNGKKKIGRIVCFRVKHRSILSSKGRTCGWSTTCRKRGRLKATTARPTWRDWRWTRCIHKHKLRYVSVYIKWLKTQDMMCVFCFFFIYQWPKHSHLCNTVQTGWTFHRFFVVACLRLWWRLHTSSCSPLLKLLVRPSKGGRGVVPLVVGRHYTS